MQYVQSKELHSIYVEDESGNSVNLHMLRNCLKKCFCCVFIKFLGANAACGLYRNLKFLCAEGCQKRSGHACMHFHVHKNKHLQRVFKCVTERQQSSMGLVKGLLSWHNVAVLAKVLL